MNTPGFHFKIDHQDGHARVATFRTPHAEFQTPIFMPVGTLGTVKALSMEEVAQTGAQIVLGNTYHLWLRPGAQVVKDLGGLHRFSRWPKAMLTDSGGFQVFSLASLRTIDDEGVTFRSHLDGAQLRLTPEESIRIQALLGADIAMAFDECPPADADRATIERAMQRTTRWALRCTQTPRAEQQALFGIVQGGTHTDLRRSHIDEIAAMNFDGVALGGLSVGEPWQEMHRVLMETAPYMPNDRPRYLMGVGTQRDLLAGIRAGIDMFDCVLPTRNARNGQALTSHGRVNIKQLKNRLDDNPIDDQCRGTCCTTGYSRGYLRHLYMAGEILAMRVLSLHNLHALADVVEGARNAIRTGTLDAYCTDAMQRIEQGDEVGNADDQPGEPYSKRPRNVRSAD